MPSIELFPNGVRGFTDTVLFNQLLGRGRKHVIIFIRIVETLASEFAFHCESDKQFFPAPKITRWTPIGNFAELGLSPIEPNVNSRSDFLSSEPCSILPFHVFR